MGFSVIPKSVGGINVNSALGPLGALFRNDKIDNLIFPSDLGSNPSMGHAVVFQAYDRTSKIEQEFGKITEVYSKEVESFKSSDLLSKAKAIASGSGASIWQTIKATANLTVAPAYFPQRVGSPLTTISLFMPESVTVNYNSSYNEISMTETLGIPGIVGSAVSDMIDATNLKSMITPYAIGLAGEAASRVFGNENLGAAITQAAGITKNPQMQLLYHGVDLREFQLEFILTPRSASEAEKVKQICDSFAFYSLPNIAGGQAGTSGQYLNPPQLFSIQFRFLGSNDIIGNVSNVISSALTNSGLGFFSSGSKINNGTEAKFFTVKDCVLMNVSVDYTPNGFATYNDGYPIQTRISLSFKETQMITKEHFAGTAISNNYAGKTLNNYSNTQQTAQEAKIAQSLGKWEG